MNAIFHLVKPLIVKSKRLQDYSSKVCGMYSLVYAFVRTEMNCLSLFFTMCDRKLNDKKIVDFVIKLHMSTNNVQTLYCYQQNCKYVEI